MSVDDLIQALEQHRAKSPLKGSTVVCLCEEEVPYKEVTSVYLDIGGGGAVILLRTREDTVEGESRQAALRMRRPIK